MFKRQRMQPWFMLSVRVLLVTAMCLCSSSPALGDGKVFARGLATPRIPDQEALIHWDAGVETLVIQTRFTREHGATPTASAGADLAGAVESSGDASSRRADEVEYGWVIPIPGDGVRAGELPEVFATTTGVFPTLRSIFSPRVYESSAASDLMAMIAIVVSLCVLVMMATRSKVLPALFVAGAAVVVILSMFSSLGGRGTGASGSGSMDSAIVKSRQRVGSYDVAILSSPDGAAIMGWLSGHGFHVDEGDKEVFAGYASQGWVFAAASLGGSSKQPGEAELSGASDETMTLATHPIGFRFRCDEPMYPLRLTAGASDELEVDLYVFGPGRAISAGFDVQRSDSVSRAENGSPGRGSSAIHLAQPQLLRLVHSAAWGTKLSARLDAAAMSQDARIEFAEGGSINAESFAPSAALARAGLPMVVGISIVSLIWAHARQTKKPVKKYLRPFGVCVGLSLIASMIVFGSMRVEYSYQSGYSPVATHYLHADVAERLFTQMGAEATIERLRTEAARLYKEIAAEEQDLNNDARISQHKLWRRRLAGMVREEDSPMNYQILETQDGGVRFVHYDRWGREHEEWRTQGEKEAGER